MRKLLLFLFAACLASSCIDNDYDLSNVNTDDITIGDEESEYQLPLATVYVGMGELSEGGVDIKSLFDEANIWLPSALSEVDLRQLLPGTAYTDELLDALLDEMATDEGKLTRVTDLIWEKYRQPFLALPELSHITDKDEALFKETFKAVFLNGASLRETLGDEIKKQAQGYLTELKVDDVTYDIGKIDIGSDIVDMLCKGLDDKGAQNPKNTLHIYGSITSALPVGMQLTPYFSPTDVRFDVTVEPGKTNAIEETQLFEEDLRQIIDGAKIVLPVSLQTYYPGSEFTSNQQIAVTLRLIKRGGLKFNF